jgi:hypothetical protein
MATSSGIVRYSVPSHKDSGKTLPIPARRISFIHQCIYEGKRSFVLLSVNFWHWILKSEGNLRGHLTAKDSFVMVTGDP